jgi:hypothetical protein
MQSKHNVRLATLERLQQLLEREQAAAWDSHVWRQLSDEDLESIVSACEKWPDGNLAEAEQAAMRRVVELAEGGGLDWREYGIELRH